MKFLLLMFLTLPFYSAFSNTYYFSESTGDDSRSSLQAQSSGTPWRSLRKLNDFMPGLQAGDSVLFKRGDVFTGFIQVRRSGTAGAPITFSAYGPGSRPVITGFATITGWTQAGNSIWEASLLTNTVNIVAMNGNVTAMGRYPNNGFLSMESTSGNQFTDQQLGGNPDWTGAEAVVRKTRWVLDRDSITLHSGNTVHLLTTSGYQPSGGYGYFIQDHPRTVDQAGEWYFNQSTQKLLLHFGNGNPSQSVVRAGTGGNLVSVSNEAHLRFSELRFEGANMHSFSLSNARNVQVMNCEIFFTGVNAIDAGGCDGLQLEGCTIQYTNNISFNANNCSNTIIRNNIISKTGIYAGMGQNNSGSYEGILLNGNNNLVEYNSIDSTGYIPITFGGNDVQIKNNFIRNFSFVKDDGGGIYTWNNIPNAPENYNRSITGNIVLNGIGAGQGTDDPASARIHGIYIDDNAANVTISGNTIASCRQYGIFVHNAHDLIIRNNTVYDNQSQLVIMHDEIAPNAPVRNIRVVNNILFSKLADQLVSEYKTIRNDLGNFGYFDSNYYCRPLNEELVIYTSYRNNGTYYNAFYDLEAWQALFNKDLNSRRGPAAIAPYRISGFTSGNKFANGSFTNDIGGLYVFATAGNATASWTNSAGLDDGALKVQFNSQTATYNQAYVVVAIGAVAANRNYILRFSSRASNEYRNMQVFLRQSQSPYHDLSVRRFRRLRATRMENEFLLTSSANENDASIIFELEEQSAPIYLDNIQLYESNVTLTNPEDSIRFEYNASSSPKTVALNASYIDARRNIYTGSITLGAYSSAVLIRRGNLAVLPLQFLLFRGMREDLSIILQWNTLPNADGGYYDVERSANGSSFEKIGQVQANASAGNSYRFTDAQPLPGNNYYRLKYQRGNRPVYSNIILVDQQGLKTLQQLTDEDLVLRPNPAVNTLQVLIHGLPVAMPVTLTMQTITGSLVRSIPTYLTNNQVRLNITDLRPGVYVMRFQADGKVLTRTFVKS